MTTHCAADRAATPQNSPQSTAPRTYPQEVFRRVLLWTFVVPPLVGLLFVAVFWRKPVWTALTMAAALFLFTLISMACLNLSQQGQLWRAARLYLTSVLLVVALFLLFIPEALILPGVIVLFILMLLAMAVEPFSRALGWGAVMALVYLVTLTLRRVIDIPPMDFGPWGDLFRFSLPVIELVIFIVLMRAVTQHLSEALAQSQRAEAGLRQLAAIVENSDDAILSKTLEGTILSWNRGAERLYGYSAEEMRGRSVSILVPPDRLDELGQITERLTRGERVEQFETV
jgi:PAS domain-containing protein